MHDLVELQLFAVERDCGCHIVHDVADADTGHLFLRTAAVIVDPRLLHTLDSAGPTPRPCHVRVSEAESRDGQYETQSRLEHPANGETRSIPLIDYGVRSTTALRLAISTGSETCSCVINHPSSDRR